MFARVSTYQGSPERTDEGIRLARESILPRLHQLDGLEGAYYLVDRRGGKAISPEHPTGKIPRTPPGPKE